MLVCVLVRWKRSTTTPETGSNRTCMIIQIPDALTQHHSEEYRISIRLRPDGFSFSGYSTLQSESFFHAVVPFVSGVSRVEAMQQLWNENPCLQWRYQQLFVQGGTSHYTWVPDEDLDDEEKKLVKNVEADGDRLVFHVLHYSSQFGEMYTMLYVYNDKSEWAECRNNLKNCGISYCYTYNKDEPAFSEHGSIGVVQVNGGLMINNNIFGMAL